MNQPTALFLADVMHNDPCSKAHHDAAAFELRRLHGLNVDKTEIIAAISAQRDAMQEMAEYWKRKHDEEETGAERYALRVQRDTLLEALRAFVSCALPVSTEIDERGHSWTEAYLDQALPIARAAIKAVEGDMK